VAELADATDLKSVEGIPHGGSSPPGAIINTRYINVDTKEELTVAQYMTYTAMIAMMPEDQEYDDDADVLAFAISNIDVSFDGSELSIGESVTASPSTVGGSATSFSYSWSIVD
jgi:hypothetical protein